MRELYLGLNWHDTAGHMNHNQDERRKMLISALIVESMLRSSALNCEDRDKMT